MSKELEPIEALDKLLDGYSRGMAGRSYYDIVREALERLEAIDNVEPSEALEAFGRITLHTEYDNDSHYDGLHFEDDCKLVDKALEFLEAIENANPSEALKCLEDLYCEPVDYRSNDKANDYETIKQALLKAEKEHKALEIIKEKRVNVGTFIHLTKILKKDYEQCKALNNTFGANICETEKEFLTKEEFNLLKEVLE